jgi:NADPH-dependent stearoyl-CoA 9-desaturase
MVQRVQSIDPGFLKRRVTRPNPLLRWDQATQAAIASDFDALAKALVSEHKAEASRALDNRYASEMYAKFKGDEERGRDLLKSGWGPVSFVRGSFLLGRSRFAQFCLGHEVLHGTYATHSEPMFRGREGWYNPLFILDKHWRYGHNRFHHKTPGVFGMDPEANPVNFRGSTDFYAETGDRATVPISAFILAFHSLFFIGLVAAKKYREIDEDAWKDLLKYNRALAKLEFATKPLEAGLMAPRVLGGNILSFFFAEIISGALGRSTHVRDDSVCLHANEYDRRNKAHFYINSLLNAGNVDYPGDRDYIGGFDMHIEHHLFPFLSSRKLDDVSDRIRALCTKYDLPYNEGSMLGILLGGVLLDVKLLVTA